MADEHADLLLLVLEDLRRFGIHLPLFHSGIQVSIEREEKIKFKEVHAQEQLDLLSPDSDIHIGHVHGMGREERDMEDQEGSCQEEFSQGLLGVVLWEAPGLPVFLLIIVKGPWMEGKG